MEYTFANPRYLYGLFSIAFLILLHFLSIKNRRHVAVKFANFDSIASIKGIDFYSKNITLLIFSIIMITSLVMAAAGLTVHYTAKVSEFSFVIALDVSESMRADDISPSRISAAKEQIINFVRNSPFGTSIGIVSFSGNSLIEHRLATNKNSLISSVEAVDIGEVSGTDIYEAILTSSNVLYGTQNKAIILLSDGQINVGGVDDAISFAQKENLIVHTIALGTTKGGQTDYGISHVDYSSLQGIAYNTKGMFSNGSSSEEIYQSLENILELKEGTQSILMTQYLLIFSILLFVIVYVLMNLHLKTLP